MRHSSDATKIREGAPPVADSRCEHFSLGPVGLGPAAPADFDTPSTQVHVGGAAEGTPPGVDGRYRALRLLGRSGFGGVWQAHDTTLRRVVAIKMPRQDRVFTEERRKLFLAEARKVAALKHPNIVPIFDAVADSSHCFLVCDYIDGTSLAKRIDQERLSF